MYEALKNEQNTLIVVPSDIVESLDVKTLAVAAAANNGLRSPQQVVKLSDPEL